MCRFMTIALDDGCFGTDLIIWSIAMITVEAAASFSSNYHIEDGERLTTDGFNVSAYTADFQFNSWLEPETSEAELTCPHAQRIFNLIRVSNLRLSD
ncbi:hypothetical protein AVEN_128857-1 [Araneus ventricosus]|uniref:Uncharacterized protein n=1 Tax=Araneus ventricosus TaxID=182803 RepID=A0A4Y2S0X6_ARAVE|nr:hypothetical protein AVEN_242438-1 [Araneus ventricosus]GBN81635.1 hypothetical protein AVEN_128857-1 [Araneus ventricosus]